MKKNIITRMIIITLLLRLCGCSTTVTDSNNLDTQKTNIDNDVSNITCNETLEKYISCTITTKGDYNKLALSFEQLLEDADLILKIKVKDTNAFVNDNGMIQTAITPTVLDVYKGVYNNEILYVNGGEMLYDEFIQNEITKKAISGHENPDGDEQYKGTYVRQIVDQQYIFNRGEEYIFFAQKRIDSGKYYSLYAYQGTFKIDNEMVKNSALNGEELLEKDICDIFNISSDVQNKKTSNLTSTVDFEFQIPEEEFVEKINNLK